MTAAAPDTSIIDNSPEGLCAAIAVTAAEGGINYWAQLIDYDPRFSTDPTIAYDAFPLVLISPVEDDLFGEDDLDHRALPLLLGDEDTEDERLCLRLSATAIRRGLNRVRMQRLPRLDAFYRALEGEDFDQASLHVDARLADIIVQEGLFGTVLFS